MSGEEDWGDQCEVYSSVTWPRARMPHRCAACHETIRRRDVYVRTFIVCDGEPNVYRHCLRCAAILDALDRAGAEAVDIRLNCGHIWDEHYGPPPDALARLAFLTPDEAQRELLGANK